MFENLDLCTIFDSSKELMQEFITPGFAYQGKVVIVNDRTRRQIK